MKVIDQKGKAGQSPDSLLLLSSLLTERPEKDWVEAIDLHFRGDEGEEFSQLLRIPYGRFVPPFLSAHQKVVSPPEFMSRLLVLFQKGGFKLNKSTGERPDHVGVVLEFLALLESEGKNPTPELMTLVTDPLKQFAKALGKATDHPLYKRVADELSDLADVETICCREGKN